MARSVELVQENPYRAAPFRYHAPPVVNATLAFSAIFLVGALVQLGFIVSSVIRAKSSRLIAPTIITITALIFSIVGFVLNITSIVVLWTDNRFDFANITLLGWNRLQVATTLFEEWPEFLILASVVIFLRDRYLVHSASTYATAHRYYVIPIIAVLAIFSIFLVFFPVIFNVLWYNLWAIKWATTKDLVNAENAYINTYYIYVGTYVLASISVGALAFAAKRITSPDSITKIIFNFVVPLLALRALARVIFVILNSLPDSDHISGLALTFWNWLFLYGLYLLTTSVLVFCLVRPHFWSKARDNFMLGDTRVGGSAAASDVNLNAQWPQRFTSDAASDVKQPSSHYK